jgi:hypothetical protein
VREDDEGLAEAAHLLVDEGRARVGGLCGGEGGRLGGGGGVGGGGGCGG